MQYISNITNIFPWVKNVIDYNSSFVSADLFQTTIDTLAPLPENIYGPDEWNEFSRSLLLNFTGFYLFLIG